MNHPIVVAITGASGAIYAARLVQVLLANNYHIHLTISPSGQTVFQQELGISFNLAKFDPKLLLQPAWPIARQVAASTAEQSACQSTATDVVRPNTPISDSIVPGSWIATSEQAMANLEKGLLSYHHFQNFMAPIASGSSLTGGMVICPCSGTTLSGVVHSSGSNLIHRAAEVHLKERRKLVLVPRETPLSQFQLENMYRASQAGVTVLPASPGWYHGVDGLADLVDFIVARILDQLVVPHTLMHRWGDTQTEG